MKLFALVIIFGTAAGVVLLGPEREANWFFGLALFFAGLALALDYVSATANAERGTRSAEQDEKEEES